MQKAIFRKVLLWRVNTMIRNLQKFSNLGHKKHACWINHYNEHDTTSFLSAYNESELKFSNMSKLALLLRTICKTGIQAKQYIKILIR